MGIKGHEAWKIYAKKSETTNEPNRSQIHKPAFVKARLYSLYKFVLLLTQKWTFKLLLNGWRMLIVGMWFLIKTFPYTSSVYFTENFSLPKKTWIQFWNWKQKYLISLSIWLLGICVCLYFYWYLLSYISY